MYVLLRATQEEVPGNRSRLSNSKHLRCKRTATVPICGPEEREPGRPVHSLLRRTLEAQVPSPDAESHPIDCCKDADHVKNELKAGIPERISADSTPGIWPRCFAKLRMRCMKGTSVQLSLQTLP